MVFVTIEKAFFTQFVETKYILVAFNSEVLISNLLKGTNALPAHDALVSHGCIYILYTQLIDQKISLYLLDICKYKVRC